MCRFGYSLNVQQTELGVGWVWRCAGKKHGATVCDLSCCGEGGRDRQAAVLSDVRVQGSGAVHMGDPRQEGGLGESRGGSCQSLLASLKQ